MILGNGSALGVAQGMVTTRERERERAMPQTSNPGPMFAEVQGTWILYLRAAILNIWWKNKSGYLEMSKESAGSTHSSKAGISQYPKVEVELRDDVT